MQAYRNLEETERPNKLRCISQALPIQDQVVLQEIDLPDDSKLAQIPCQDIPGINFDDLISPVDNFFEFFSNSNSYEQPLPEQDIALWNSTLQDFVVREDL